MVTRDLFNKPQLVTNWSQYVERFGIDGLRYFVLREMTLGQDADFTDQALLTRYNSDLANDLGNLRGLLADSDINAEYIAALLVDDGVEGDGSLAVHVNFPLLFMRSAWEEFWAAGCF